MRAGLKRKNPIQFQYAFTLIEMIGVLAVIAILALVLAPVLIRQMDRIAGETESASLRSMGEALQQSILRNRYIPTYTNWHSTVATELGVNVSNVTINGRGQPRFFLIDPNWQIGSSSTAGQEYVQTMGGTARGANLRVLILSSIGQRMINMVSGVPSVTADFNAIWDWSDASAIAPSASCLAGFTRGEDLKVQRVNMSPLFVRLVLNTYASSGSPRYSIDTNDWATAVVITNTVTTIDSYFIKNSILTLYTHLGSNDSQQILISDNSFVYNENVWRGSIGGGGFVAGLDLARVVDQFLSAPSNPNAHFTNLQQILVVSNMQVYMDAYSTWAERGFPNGGNFKTKLNNAYSAMIIAVQDEYLGSYAPPLSGVACPP